MSDVTKIIECPRDAWQGLPQMIPAEVKAAYLRKLIAAGFKHIDAVSFVSPAAVPQMADAERVLELLDLPQDVETIGIVVNARGAERALKTGKVRTLGFPFSTSPTFLRRNQNQTEAEALRGLETIGRLAAEAGMGLVAYLSMAFGNPYGDAWSAARVRSACRQLIDLGVRQISLADTVGLATPGLIAETLRGAFAAEDEVEFGVHLHARPSDAAAKVRSAYEAGCRRFDGAIGGLGGCPFAQDALVGNVATEMLLAELNELGAKLLALQALEEVIQESDEIGRRYGGAA
jgi:hydroxymethylglutaryl-CoA lyase